MSIVDRAPSLVEPKMDIIHEAVKPVRSSRIQFTWNWKSSGAQEIPKESLLKWYCPKGVMKVVRGLDFVRSRYWNLAY